MSESEQGQLCPGACEYASLLAQLTAANERADALAKLHGCECVDPGSPKYGHQTDEYYASVERGFSGHVEDCEVGEYYRAIERTIPRLEAELALLRPRAALADEMREHLVVLARIRHLQQFPHLQEGNARHASGATEREIEVLELLARYDALPVAPVCGKPSATPAVWGSDGRQHCTAGPCVLPAKHNGDCTPVLSVAPVQADARSAIAPELASALQWALQLIGNSPADDHLVQEYQIIDEGNALMRRWAAIEPAAGSQA